MDVARRVSPARRFFPRVTAILGGAVVLASGVWGAVSLRTGYAPTFSVDRASVITDTVHHGSFVRSIPASGTFAARRVAVVGSSGDGVVDAIFVRPGASVTASTVVARLANPSTESEIADARAQITTARAELASIRQQALTARLEREQAVRATQAERAADQDQVTAQRSLHAQGLIADLPYRQIVIKLAEARDREGLQRAEIASTDADGAAKIAAGEAHVVQLQGMLARRLAERSAMLVRAGIDGTIQSVLAQLGARVTAGSELARVADQHDLEAKLAVVEGDARSIRVGLSVEFATPAGTARGTVVRIDPAASGGTVEVEVTLDRVPLGIRADEHIQAKIELERIDNATWVTRPAGAADDTTVQLYKIIAPDRAQRISVRLGRGSSDRIAVVSGLHPGEKIIVSDMSAAGDHALIALQ